MKFLTTALLLLLSVMGFSQKIWEKTIKSTGEEVLTTELPVIYQLYDLNTAEIKNALKDAPKRFENSSSEKNVIVSFPNRKGELQQFKIFEAPMMEAELAAKFPMIKTYIGQGIDDPTAILNLSIGTNGINAMIRATGKSPFFIEPYTKNRNKYIAYSKVDKVRSAEFSCGVQGEAAIFPNVTSTTENITDGLLRTYNLVVATTIEYSAFHLNNQGVPASATTAVKKAAVLSAIVTTMNRVKGIYETELGATFVLNANNENVIFIDSDNFSNNNSYDLIDESQTVIDNIIGNANYDVGHTFSTGGGGLASLGGICTTTNKARAITGSGNPIGDGYDVDYVAHEIGHHFGANHTYNGTGVGSCGTTVASTAAEPGSGTTIMAYAGICGSLNVQSNSDAYFHILSLKEINNRFNNLGNFTNPFWKQCSDNTNTGNQEPIANAGSDYTIPNGTPFVLQGSGSDPDNNPLTYGWDQLDLAQPNVYPLVSTTTTGPLYRSLFPSTSPNRYMPAFETVYNGAIQSTWEVTPTVARTLNFNLTVRDNVAGGGQSTSDDMVVTVAAVGPFEVTSQSAVETWATGETKTISWDVAGTTANGINVANVEITLVDDSGAVLSTLAASTPNDGNHNITVPSIINDDVRVKVAAIGNIFYALNSAIIAVNTTPAYCNTVCASSGSAQYPDGTTLVSFNTINNASTGASAYTNYTSISTNVTRGQSYNLTVNVNTDGSYTEKTMVWIDWNRNCNFTDAGEEYNLGSAVNVTNGATSLSPFSIIVPEDAALGETRMRVTSAYNAYKTPCATSFFGEVEDYTLNVITVIPVELTRFEATPKDRAIQLDWATASETNNAGFQIQRGTDGIKFENIGWVAGNGTSLEAKTYQYLDEKVNINQQYYYRLKQMDYDEAFEYSMIKAAIIVEKGNNISVYPNPASDKITVEINEELLENKDVTFYLSNAIGQTVTVAKINSSQTTVSLDNLPSGVYFYRVVSGLNTLRTDKLIVR
jgi:hypothetical protein